MAGLVEGIVDAYPNDWLKHGQFVLLQTAPDVARWIVVDGLPAGQWSITPQLRTDYYDNLGAAVGGVS